ncbi:hypothetical protein LEP1GSC029_3933 [Leptospira interrogans str. 2002000626]|uniref:Uncharacterized protein n=1 Tax=Leptospira interrogans str. 2002000626 TaxID=996803 RepID=A0A829D1S1_LEPIR|nr:hypothetical protein LEP1GSC029_3933 [Leptospira interrogans str. 2002000626]
MVAKNSWISDSTNPTPLSVKIRVGGVPSFPGMISRWISPSFLVRDRSGLGLHLLRFVKVHVRILAAHCKDVLKVD